MVADVVQRRRGDFHTAAQQGIDAQIYWPGVGQVRATELILRRLLPMAHQGLEEWGVESAVRDRLLGIIEQRCLIGTNGAEGFTRRVHAETKIGTRGPRTSPHAGGLPGTDAHQRSRARLGLIRSGFAVVSTHGGHRSGGRTSRTW